MWKRLDISDLRLILSEDETNQLNAYSVNAEMTDIVNATIDMVSDNWRGALSAKGYELDAREHYTPSTYRYYVLVHCRHAVWTRFPNSKQIALDDARKAEYDKAMELLKDPILDVDPVSPEGQPESGNAIGTGAGSIRVPLHRIDPWYLENTQGSIRLENYL